MDTNDYRPHLELFACKLKEQREARHLSRSRFAAMVGISRRYLINLETARANPTLGMLLRLAASLEIDVREFVDFDAIERRQADDGTCPTDIEHQS